jgi:hypothetical protein
MDRAQQLTDLQTFRVSLNVERHKNRAGHCFKDGDLVKLIDDDGSDCPEFERLVDGVSQYVHLSEIEPV